MLHMCVEPSVNPKKLLILCTLSVETNGLYGKGLTRKNYSEKRMTTKELKVAIASDIQTVTLNAV